MVQFGQDIDIPVGRDGHLAYGSLDLWIRQRRGEWHLAATHDAELEDREPRWEIGTAPGDVVWERWVVGHQSHAIRLQPIPPDRPVVVRPEMPVRMRSGQATDFYVGLPLWIQVAVQTEDGAEELCEFPSKIMSSTWFGTPQNGELCYSMRTHAHRHYEDLLSRQHRCICPLQVRNRSDEVLSFERICVRCQHLHVYHGEPRFWTNVVRLSYRGRQEWSRIVYGTTPPAESGAARLITRPRQRVARALGLESFRNEEKWGGTT
jgi:hypothetical protein